MLYGPQVYLQPVSLSRVLDHLERSDLAKAANQESEATVKVGSVVELLDKNTQELITFKIAAPRSQIAHSDGITLSPFSPLGSELLGRKVGESAVVRILGTKSAFLISQIQS